MFFSLQVLNGLDVSYDVEEIDGRSDMDALQDCFEKVTGARTVRISSFCRADLHNPYARDRDKSVQHNFVEKNTSTLDTKFNTLRIPVKHSMQNW